MMGSTNIHHVHHQQMAPSRRQIPDLTPVARPGLVPLSVSTAIRHYSGTAVSQYSVPHIRMYGCMARRHYSVRYCRQPIQCVNLHNGEYSKPACHMAVSTVIWQYSSTAVRTNEFCNREEGSALIVTTVNTKGGTAKTTTTIALANELAIRNPDAHILVADLDKQGSATEWADLARDNGTPLPFQVDVCNIKRLPRIASQVVANDAMFIDTPPGDSAAIQAAIEVADFVIIPTLASGLDTSRVWETLRTLDASQMHAVLLTSVRLGTNLFEQTKAAFDSEGISRFDTVIPLRESIRASYGYRPTHDVAYGDVLTEMMGALV